MASGPLVENGNHGDGSRERNRWSKSKVYTRKIHHNRPPKTTTAPPQPQTPVTEEETNTTSKNKNDNDSSQQQDNNHKDTDNLSEQRQEEQQQQGSTAVSDDLSNQHQHQQRQVDVVNDEKGQKLVAVEENGSVSISRSDNNHVFINLSSRSKQEVRELKRKLVSELEQVRKLLKKLEDKDSHLNGYSTNSQLDNVVVDNSSGLMLRSSSVDHVVDINNNVGLRSSPLDHVIDDNNDGFRSSQPLDHVVENNGGFRSSQPLDHVVENNGGFRSSPLDHVVDNDGGLNPQLDDVVDNSGLWRNNSEVVSVGNGNGATRLLHMADNVFDNGGYGRMSSEVVSVGNGEPRSLYEADNGGYRRVNSQAVSVGNRVPRSLHVAVMENGHGRNGMNDIADREKRTPKANQYYKNSGFIVGKEKFPPLESNKKSKTGKKHGMGGRTDYGVGVGIQYTKVFKNCSSLLSKLLKHKWGWIFAKPVDVKGLGLHDYYFIIKHPMDLGTVKSSLNSNLYQSPREFAEEVRLTFNNAMTYNPKGQDAHIMAETLSKIFEDEWNSMENDYDLDSWYQVEREVYAPTVRKVAPLPGHLPSVSQEMRSVERLDSMARPVYKPKPAYSAPQGRAPALKKPKAKDLNKRDMTYEEKQRLSTNLQTLPSEKLDSIVQIIKKRNVALSQKDDEIEVDIDSVDAETLWELDRFVTNYKKSLSKYKRKAELALQVRQEAEFNFQQHNLAPGTEGLPREIRRDERHSSPIREEKQEDNASSRSSSSSSSSSDSGSSSSDSDSDSSSGSDAGDSPRT